MRLQFASNCSEKQDITDTFFLDRRPAYSFNLTGTDSLGSAKLHFLATAEKVTMKKLFTSGSKIVSIDVFSLTSSRIASGLYQ
ncbi:hypothetical protein D3C76_1666890 [compost metagenome]